MTGYTRDDLLVEPSWLADRLENPGLRIVDCDVYEAYLRAHIPGAVGVSDNFFKDPNDRRYVMAADQFAETMARMGIGDDTEVVAYDASGLHFAPRLWWCLTYYGHGRIRLLNGGWQQWVAQGLPVSYAETKPPRARFTPRPDESLRATIDDIRGAIDRPGAKIVDSRSLEEWTGENDRGNRRAGHIPGAVRVEWKDNIAGDMRVKPADELRAMYESAGVTPDREIITHCQAGVRAANAMLALKLLGYERVRNYDGSFLEWANRDDTPIVR